MASYDKAIESYKKTITTAASLAASLMLVRGVVNELVPYELRDLLFSGLGYLLYGPPGTGKSSLVAAMANYLRFDIYDLELTEVKSNSDLRRLLVGMSNRSILVVEDIDCTIDLQQRTDEADNNKSTSAGEEGEDKVTLSGFLNFVDGLWSTSGEERLIVFTTNYRERLDPALLRPGRMDMHIHMGYCGGR